MASIKRKLLRAASSIINIYPNTDYRVYTSVNTSACKAASNDMQKVGNDLKWAVKGYVADKK